MLESSLSHRRLMPRLRGLALEALRAWPVQVQRLSFLNLSENAVYEVAAQDGRRYILRLHRPDYQSPESIRSELFWLDALTRDTALSVPRPVRSLQGRLLEHASTQALPQGRHAVLFERLPGRMVGRTYGVPTMRKLGALLAQLHLHAQSLERPAWFARRRLSAPVCVGPEGLFGDPLKVPDLSAGYRDLMAQVNARVMRELADYEARGDRMGLIHNDLHFYNLLTDQGELRALDFDDCVVSYWMSDLMIAIRMMRKRPDQPRLREALLEGYCQHRAVERADLEVLGALGVMSLNMGLAWCNSRRALPRIQKQLPMILQFTQEANRRYLEGLDPLMPRA